MMESSGGGCRCACQDDFHDPQDQSTGCCSPHVFTSVLLGILSCVLMTGGVFLAFHRWDPMWLMVSGVGVVLIIIGTILHCCNNLSQKPKRHSSVGKGCCTRPVPPDHAGHMISNNGSITEQLLPLSNARSVSQLSLNMLPGYFPPVVTAYGIEQHSAVVQNINRVIQQQQQLNQQQQPPQQPQQQQQQAHSPASICPSAVSNSAGKSFIVLSLPGDASTANIQNLVATVFQLDGSTLESAANEVIPNVTAPVVSIKPNSPVPLILKNAEVQTCNMWPATSVAAVPSTSGENIASRSSANSTNECLEQATSQPAVPSTASCGSTQTDDILPIAENISLIDCSTDITAICDNSSSSCDNQSSAFNSALVNIPSTSSTDLLAVSLTNTADCSNNILVDIPEPPTENVINPASTNLLVDVADSSTNPQSDCPEILIDISENCVGDISSNNSGSLLEDLVNNDIQQSEIISDTTNAGLVSCNNSEIEPPQIVPESTNSNLQSVNPEILSSTSNLSSADTEIDDSELMARSSPPPSYEDVTLEGESVGAFGLAYGTI